MRRTIFAIAIISSLAIGIWSIRSRSVVSTDRESIVAEASRSLDAVDIASTTNAYALSENSFAVNTASDDDLLDADELNELLVSTGMSPQLIETLIREEGIYTAYVLALQEAKQVGGGGTWDSTDEPVIVTGTMVHNPQGCWVLLVDGFVSTLGYQLDYLPPEYQRNGQRVRLAYRAQEPELPDPHCKTPLVDVLDISAYSGHEQAGTDLSGLQDAVSEVLAELGIEASVTASETYVTLSRLVYAERESVLAALEGQFGFASVRSDQGWEYISLWPIAAEY